MDAIIYLVAATIIALMLPLALLAYWLSSGARSQLDTAPTMASLAPPKRPAPFRLGALKHRAFFGLAFLLCALCVSVVNLPSAQAQTPNLNCSHIPSNPTQGEVTANGSFDCIDNSDNRWLDIATGDANVALTTSQQYQNGFLKFTGALTAGRNITLQAEDRDLTVWNATTGGFNLTFTYGSGTTVVVSPNTVVTLHGDASATTIVGEDVDVMRYGTSGVDGTADYFLFWDASANAYKRVLGNNLPGSGGGGAGTGGPAVFKGALVQRGTAQSISNATATKVNWDAETYDSDAFHDNVTNNTRLSVPTGTGITKVIVEACVDWASNNTGDRRLEIFENGVAFQGAARIIRTSKDDSRECVVTAPIGVTAGTDYFEVEVEQSSGGALNLDTSNHTWATIYAVQYTSFRGALAKRTTNQSIANNTATAVNWDAEEYDTSGIHDNVTNNARLTVPTGVTRVQLCSNIQWGAGSTGFRQMLITKNGAAVQGQLDYAWPAAANLNHRTLGCSAVLSVTGGDYFELIVQHTQGAALNVETSASTWFSMEIVE